MTVSVLINNYNYEQYLAAAIDSVLSQQNAEFELIVVDDGSTDSSPELIRNYGSRLIALFQENARQGVAVSNGFARSSGDIVVILDADDTLLPGALQRIVTEFEKHPSIARLQWPMTVTDETGKPTGQLTPDPHGMVSGDLAEHILRYRTHIWPATSGNAYARSALNDLLPAPAGYEIGIDLYLAETTPFFGEVVSLIDSLSTYRNHGSNTWLNRVPDGEYLRKKIEFTTRTHPHVVRVAREHGYTASENPRSALDVAFICQRLASLRLDPANHPFSDDSRLGLTLRGVKAALLHPHHTPQHKLKRTAWILGTGVGTTRIAKRLINRFYG